MRKSGDYTKPLAHLPKTPKWMPIERFEGSMKEHLIDNTEELLIIPNGSIAG
jgi:hypothetical protein